jgi:hypothetical protein
VFAAFAQIASKDEIDELFEIAKDRQREVAKPVPERYAEAGEIIRTKTAATIRKPSPPPVVEASKAEETIDRLPNWMKHRLARQEQMDAEASQAQQLAERYLAPTRGR